MPFVESQPEPKPEGEPEVKTQAKPVEDPVAAPKIAKGEPVQPLGDGRVAWDVDTSDARTGCATAGQEFRIEDGAILLVSDRDADVRVRQLQTDLDWLDERKPSSPDVARRLAAMNEAVATSGIAAKRRASAHVPATTPTSASVDPSSSHTSRIEGHEPLGADRAPSGKLP